jgi:ketosteroid isomerase-like protein
MTDLLQALLDKEAIRDLRTLYSHHLDGNDIDALDQVFTPDAVVEVTVGVMCGIDEIRADRWRMAHQPFPTGSCLARKRYRRA